MMRNAVWTALGDIDAEIEHPEYGWIPITLSARDPSTADLFAQASAGAVAPYVPPTPEQARATMTPLSRMAFMERLYAIGQLETVNALMAQADPLVKLRWDTAVEFTRNDPLIDQFGAMIGLSPEQIDALYQMET